MKPRLWAGLAPFGIGQTKPHHYAEMARAVWDNRRSPLYAWRILSRGANAHLAIVPARFAVPLQRVISGER